MDSLVLVGITYLTHEEQLISQEQMHGRVVTADPEQGICLKLDGVRNGDHYWLPPDTGWFKDAAPGTYTLRSTGETVENPDYLVTVIITAAPPSEN